MPVAILAQGRSSGIFGLPALKLRWRRAQPLCSDFAPHSLLLQSLGNGEAVAQQVVTVLLAGPSEQYGIPKPPTQTPTTTARSIG
eukprot:12364027-Prorocentrum_lima.AAC.1